MTKPKALVKKQQARATNEKERESRSSHSVLSENVDFTSVRGDSFGAYQLAVFSLGCFHLYFAVQQPSVK